MLTLCRSIPIENPATGETIALCQSASEQDVERTVSVAQAAFNSGIWSRADRNHRADVLEKIAELFIARMPELIALEVRQTGRVIREMRAQVPSLTRWFKYYAALLRTEERPVLPTTGKLHNWVDRVPLGVVVQITPFNHPLLIAVKKLAPALAAGNSVIIKPSELTPLTTLHLAAIAQEAGIPNGVLSVLPGYGAATGKALVSHPLVQKVDVTGGTPSGRAIGAIAGANLARYTAELGGKAPVIVAKHANIDQAVNGVAFGAFVASGQTCIAATRIIVYREKMDEFITKLKAKCISIEKRMGSPENEKSAMGSLISAKQLQHVTELVNDATERGVSVVAGGSQLTEASALDGHDLSKGYFYAPTILADGPDYKLQNTRIWKEEAFGPVVVVVPFDTESMALELANDSDFGLGAAIWTQDLSQAHRLSGGINAGIVWVNTHHRNDPSSPWGGAPGGSGVGSENGVDAFNAYTTMKSTIINFASVEEGLKNDDWFREEAGEVRYG